MTSEEKRSFLALGLLCLAVASVASYEDLEEYRPEEDRGVRMGRRCPSCPPDCPEALASPWYGRPTVYGQPVNPRAPNQGQHRHHPHYYRHGPVRADQFRVNAPRFPFSDSRCDLRFARGTSEVSEAPQEMQGSYRAMENLGESRQVAPYAYQRPSRAPFAPRRFAEAPLEDQELVRHYENVYEDSPRGQNLHNEPPLTSPNWEEASLPENPMESYQQPRNFIQEDRRLRAFENPSRNKVFVVYRADRDSEDEEGSPMEYSRENNVEEEKNSQFEDLMSDSELEEVVRRAVEVAREKLREERMMASQKRVGSYHRDQELDSYARFNPEAAIDRQERRKLLRTGSKESQVVFTPEIRFVPTASSAVEPEELGIEDSEEKSEWEGPEGGIEGLEDGEEFFAEGEGSASSLEEQEVREEDERSQEEGRELEAAPINYRTHSRAADAFEKEINAKSRRGEDEEEKTVASGVSANESEERDIKIDPDLMEDMQIPPLKDEVLSAEGEKTTPSTLS